MNLSHRAALDLLKREIDEEFGEVVVWISQVGQSDNLTGTFSLQDKEVTVKGKTSRNSQFHMDSVTATFAVSPNNLPCKEGDFLEISGIRYVILPFNSDEFSVVLPLKPVQEKDQNWR